MLRGDAFAHDLSAMSRRARCRRRSPGCSTAASPRTLRRSRQRRRGWRSTMPRPARGTRRPTSTARGRRRAAGVAPHRGGRPARSGVRLSRPRRRRRVGVRSALRQRREPDPGARVGQAQRAIEDMLAAARTEAQRAAALTAPAPAALMAADHLTGVASAREALALAQSLGPPWLRFEAARLLAVGLAQQGTTAEAEAQLPPFEGLVAAEGSVEQRGHYWSDLAYVLNSARRLRARPCAVAGDRMRPRAGRSCRDGDADHQPRDRLRQPRPRRPGPRAGVRARALQAGLAATGGPTGGVIEAHVGLYSAALGYYGSRCRRSNGRSTASGATARRCGSPCAATTRR